MLIYASWRENDRVNLKFFASKEAYLIVRQLVKNNGEKSGSESSKMCEKQILGP